MLNGISFFLRAKKTFPFMKRKVNMAIFSYVLEKGASVMLESCFQSNLIRELEQLFPGCIVMKNDPNYRQGFPDLTIFYGRHWATLECKKDRRARKQPNQDYYVGLLNEMSFSRFICPENKKEVLYELQQAFES